MKPRNVEAERFAARQTLVAAHAHVGQDFHTLSSSQVDTILVEADRVKYRKPKYASKSRGHCFYDLLQRRAR